jgi:hypothetical protein
MTKLVLVNTGAFQLSCKLPNFSATIKLEFNKISNYAHQVP